MKHYNEQLKSVIQAILVHSTTAYSWFGARSPELPKAVKRVLTPDTARNYLLLTLQSRFYNNFYCKGLAVPTQRETIYFPAWGMTPFVEKLSKANSGEGYYTEGWQVGAIKGGEIILHREGIELRAHPENCMVPQGASITIGAPLSLRFPKEFLGISPGFYMALSNKELSQEDSQQLVRIYCNNTPEGAVHFMQSATQQLNRSHLPFKLKVINDQARFTRCDSTVLYIRKDDYEAVVNILAEIYPRLAAHLRRSIPSFTKLLAPGLGLAEDPGQGYSFGLHRCGILAEGIIRAYEQGKKSEAGRLEVLKNCFGEFKIHLEEPFLNPDSSDAYSFPSQFSQQRPRSPNVVLYTDSDANAFLQTAHGIGERLVKQAIWYRDRCNWVGAGSNLHSFDSNMSRMIYKTLGSEMYSGTSGVALFLAELFAATGDTEVRRTALGAIRQALSRSDSVPPPTRLGFYGGWVGIAFAAAHVGTVFGEEEFLNDALQLFQCLMHENQNQCEFDLLSGTAGAIAALVVLGDILDNTSILDFATRVGDELVQAANKNNTGYSWNTAAFPIRRNLTGFSHGAAGIGYALLELFQATGYTQYRAAAEQAFNYERHWFDASLGNWPDFREESATGKRNKHSLSFATTWCHGAPGIALSRLRAYEILHDKKYKSEAIIGLQTTRKAIEAWLDSGTANYSLCHGLAGNAEVFLYGCQVLGEELSEGSKLTIDIANNGIEMYSKTGQQWPCGNGGGDVPGLMLGLAGIGYFYLRLYNPRTPSILLLRHENFMHKPKQKEENLRG